MQTDEPDLLLGGAVLLLLLQSHEWMHRRVESVRFLDEQSLVRRVSVDLTLPTEELTALEIMPVLPLAFLEKEVLVGFDVEDDQGTVLPILTKAENGLVAWSVLVRLAERELEEAGLGPLPRRLRNELHEIATGDEGPALDLLDALERRGNKGQAIEKALVEGWYFMSVAYNLATRFLLLAPIAGTPGDRRVIKFSYLAELDKPTDVRSRINRAASWIGWPAEFNFPTPAIGEAASYHFEFVSPSELRIVWCQAVVDTIDRIYVMEGTTTGPRAHIYVGDEDPEADGFVSVWLRPPRTGLTRASLALTTATLGLILFFLHGNRIVEITTNQPVAILLSIPALVSSFIVRPGEHGLATDLLAGVRGTVGLAGLTALLGATLLVGEVADSTLLRWWRVLAIVAGLCFLSTLMVFVGGPLLGRFPEGAIPVTDTGDNEKNGKES